MNRASCLTSIVLLIGMNVQTTCGADQPNFLIIMADDCTYNDLPVYDGQNARTPYIDQLATQDLTFKARQGKHLYYPPNP